MGFKVSNQQLVKIAVYGGFATVTMGFLARGKLNDRISATDYYKEAMKTLRTNRGAAYILGEPIKDGNVDVGDTSKNYTKELDAKYEVPVRGSKDKGTMYFWAKRNSIEEHWYVRRIELGLKSEPNKRLLVMNKEN